MPSRSFAALKIIAFLLTLACFSSLAQQTTGTIVGTVTDSSGALVPQATVTITNTDKNQVARTLKTNEAGAFTAPNLPVGTYSVKVEAAGFKSTTFNNIPLNVNDQRKVEASLQAGSVAENVEVQADPLQVETQNATATGLITGTQVRELALKSRNYEELVALMPGVTSDTGDTLYVGVSAPGGATNEVAFSINGSFGSQNNWTIDGADNVDRGGNFTLLNYPSVDAIAEFKVLRGNYSAEYGRGAGGQINLVTRSGESRFHGGVYEFFRNDALNANSWLNNRTVPQIPKTPLRYNDFGGTFGGPIFIPGHYNTGKNKTFFFFSEELRRVSESGTNTASVPTAAERGTSTGGVPTFVDPVCVDYPTCSVISNTIPTAAINPASAAYLKDIYSHVALPQDAANHLLNVPSANKFNYRQEIIRVDHYVSERLNAMFRYMNDNIPTVEGGGLFNGNALPFIAQTSTNSPGRNIIGKVTFLPSPTLINEFAYAYSYGAVISDNTGLLTFAASPDVAQAITLPFSNQLKRIPNISFTNGTGFSGFGNYRDFNRNHNVFDNLTKVVGNHTLKFGFTFNAYQKSENAAGNNSGSFSFSQGSSFVPGGANATSAQNFEQEWANFLTGNSDQFTQLSQDFNAEVRQKQLELYAQDQFRVRPNLTLDYGLRYSLYFQPTDANGRSTSFDPRRFNPANAPSLDANGNICTSDVAPCAGAVPNPNFDPLNGIIIGGKNSPFGSAVAQTNHLLFQPRIGIAYDPSGKGKTSVRAGYGVFVESPGVNYIEGPEFGNPPFVQSTTISGALLNNPLAGTPTNNSVLTVGGASIHWHQPYVQQYNLDIQHELPYGLVADIGYYGSKGTHLVAAIDINQPVPGVTGAQFDAGTQTLLNPFRPFIGYGSINIYTPEFKSNYNSLQSSLQKRFSGGSLIAANYTYAKSLTDQPFDPNFSVPQNTYDLHAEYGPTRFDRRHTFTADFVYGIPFLRAQQGFTGRILGGWEVSGVVAVSSGAYLTPTTTSTTDPGGTGIFANPFNAASSGPRPDQVFASNNGAPHTAAQWFNTAAFADVGPNTLLPGNARRASILGPGYQRWDLSLFKNFKLFESLSMQFRAEAFNIFNHVNYSTVDTQLGSSQYGQVTSAHDPRTLQFGLKLNF